MYDSKKEKAENLIYKLLSSIKLKTKKQPFMLLNAIFTQLLPVMNTYFI